MNRCTSNKTYELEVLPNRKNVGKVRIKCKSLKKMDSRTIKADGVLIQLDAPIRNIERNDQ